MENALLENDLPDDLWICIFKWLEICDLAKVAAVCCRFNRLASCNSVWNDLESDFLNVTALEGFPIKDLCRISRKWKKGQGYQYCFLQFKENFMPWTQLNNDRTTFYLSTGDHIQSWSLTQQTKRCGKSFFTHHRKFTPRSGGEINKFRVHGSLLVAAGWNGNVYWKNTAQIETHERLCCHDADIYALDFADNTLLTGSRGSLKIWNISQDLKAISCVSSFFIDDKVCSLKVNPEKAEFLVGTAGITSHPLQMWSLERGVQLYQLGSNFKLGAAPLDTQFLNGDLLISAGYDTFVRLWDCRLVNTYKEKVRVAQKRIEMAINNRKCVKSWEEPHDNTIYCVTSDCNHMIVSGSCRHGVVRFWDMRLTKPVQTFYFGSRRVSSPVYSLQITRTHLLAALARSLHCVEFT